MAQETYRIEIDVELKDNTHPGVDRAQKAINKLEQDAARAQKQLDRMTRSRWNVIIGAVDNAMHTIHRVERALWGLTRRTWRITIGIAGAPFRALNALKDTLLSERLFIGTLMAAGAAHVGAIQPMKLANEFTRANIALRTFLGNQQKATEFMRQLVQFGVDTPFEMDFLTEQAAKLLPSFKDNPQMILRTLKAFGDAAALTGATEHDIELALLGFRQIKAIGKLSLEELKQVTENLRVPMEPILEELGVAQEDLKDLGKKGIPAAKAMEAIIRALERPIPKGGFLGGMTAIMDTLGGQWSMFRDIIKNRLILRWGQGLESVVLPALKRMNEWLAKNDKEVEELGNALYEAGRAFAQFFVDGAKKAKDALTRLVESPEWKEAKGFEKLKIAWDKLIEEPFERWWNTGGREWIRDKAREIGETFGQAFGAMLMGLFGVSSADVSDQSPFVQAGAEAGRAFTEGFLENFDTGAIVHKLLSAFANIQPTWLGGNTETLGGQLFVLGLDLFLISYVFRRVWRMIKRTQELVQKLKKMFGKNDKDKPEVLPIKQLEDSTKKLTNETEKQGRKWLDTIRKWVGRAKRLTRGIPVFNIGLNIFDLFTAQTNIDRAGAVGGIVGGIGGATLGSFFGPIGINVGSILGGLIGEWIGRSIAQVDWGSVWNSITQSLDRFMSSLTTSLPMRFSNITESIKQFFADLPYNIGYFLGYSFGTVETWGQNVLNSVTNWLSQLPGNVSTWFSNAWANAEQWLQQIWNSTEQWFSQAWQSADEWLMQIATSADDWAAQAVDYIVGWFSDLPGKLEALLIDARDRAIAIAASIPGAIANAFNSAVGGLGTLGRFAVDLVKGGLDKAAELGRRVARGFEAGYRASKGNGPKRIHNIPEHAYGGIFSTPHIGMVAERGPEAIIPLSPNMRSRGLSLWMQAGHMLGVFSGGSTPNVPVSIPSSSSVNVTLQVSPQYSVTVTSSNPDEVAQMLRANHRQFAEELANMLAEAIEDVWSNMPVTA